MSSPHVLSVREVGLNLAQELLDAVRSEAEEHNLALGAAVVDKGGNIVAVIRMDGAPICGVPIAVDKAFTAVALAAPTDAWASSTQPGGENWGMSTALGGRVVVYPGGLPLIHNGELIGGLGASGAEGHEDKMCVLAAIESVGLEVADGTDNDGGPS